MLGAGLGFATIGFVTFAGKAGQTAIGSQGLVTFDPVGYKLQSRIPRVAMGSIFTVAGSVFAGVGGSMFAKNAAVAGDPLATARRHRRVQTTGALMLGTGGATVLGSLFLLAFASGEWSSIPVAIDQLRPEYQQSAHNTAAYISWGAGLLSLGAGTLSAGLGLLSGNKQSVRMSASFDRSGAGLAVSGQF